MHSEKAKSRRFYLKHVGQYPPVHWPPQKTPYPKSWSTGFLIRFMERRRG